MKRAITLIMVLGIVIAGAAAETIQVNYELDTSDLEEIKVVFTANPVSDVNGAKGATNESPVTLTAGQGATEATYGTGDTGLYLVWYAYTADNVKVTLGIDPMEATGTGSDGNSKSYLPWTVTVSNEYQITANNGTALPASQSSGSNDDTVTDGKNISTKDDPDAAAKAVEVVSVTSTSSMKQTWGNKSISAKATLTDAVAGEYSGTITATISAT